jgi:hypothetical protein
MAVTYSNAEIGFDEAMTTVWRALGAHLVGRTFHFPSHPEHSFTVLEAMRSGALEILERGCRRRYVDGAVIARCWAYNVLHEVIQ